MPTKTIILSKGGTKQREVPLSELQVPDLWYVSEFLAHQIRRVEAAPAEAKDEDGNDLEYPEDADTEKTYRLERLEHMRQDVLKCWHLAHDLLNHIRNESATPPEQKTFRLHWWDGKITDVQGTDVIGAMTKAGYGWDAIRALDYHEEVKPEQNSEPTKDYNPTETG